jgi:hypothetical protein
MSREDFKFYIKSNSTITSTPTVLRYGRKMSARRQGSGSQPCSHTNGDRTPFANGGRAATLSHSAHFCHSEQKREVSLEPIEERFIPEGAMENRTSLRGLRSE